MTLYEIDDRLMQLVDQETGEILDSEEFDKLVMARDTKIENVALWEKNESAMADAIGEEIKKLQARKKVCENRVTRLKNYLLHALEGEKFRTERVAVSFRNGSKTTIANEQALIEWAQANRKWELLNVKPPEISKTAIKIALDRGEEIPGASIEPSVSVIIK